MTYPTDWDGSWGRSASSLFDFIDFLAWWEVNIRGGEQFHRCATVVFEGSEFKPA